MLKLMKIKYLLSWKDVNWKQMKQIVNSSVAIVKTALLVE